MIRIIIWIVAFEAGREFWHACDALARAMGNFHGVL